MTFSSLVHLLFLNTNIEITENNPVHLQEAIIFDFHYQVFKGVWALSYLDKIEKEVQWKMGALKN